MGECIVWGKELVRRDGMEREGWFWVVIEGGDIVIGIMIGLGKGFKSFRGEMMRCVVWRVWCV